MVRKKSAENFIAVHADWYPGRAPFLLGRLYSHAAAGRETFSFEFSEEAVSQPELLAYTLDPHLGLYKGAQFCPPGQPNFGLFQDASPDRWGRTLLKRRFERRQARGEVAPNARLVESDYLLGVHDSFRIGGLRFRLNDEGPFLDDDHDQAAPPFVRLRELEAASLALEKGEDSPYVDDWLKMLVAPGGSLGGARPKASVVDTDGSLWIAKFPSKNDTRDMGAWELVALTLAKACGLQVPDAHTKVYGSNRHTLLVRRFDRTEANSRLHFASAMTMTGHKDGEDESTGVSYMEIAQVLIQSGANVEADLRELWSRIVFNMLIANTDDHLRNHGFLLDPNAGWHLSPAYDLNPIPDGGVGLKLNVNGARNDLDLNLALEVAPYYRLDPAEAATIVDNFKDVTSQWRTLARELALSRREIEDMAYAFRLADAATH